MPCFLRFDVDAGEALREHHRNVQVAGFHRGVFAARTFAVVVVADDDGMDAVVLVPARNLRGRVVGLRFGVPDAARAVVEGAHGTFKEEGLGLGLSIVRGIVESHAGRLTFERGGTGSLSARVAIPVAKMSQPSESSEAR